MHIKSYFHCRECANEKNFYLLNVRGIMEDDKFQKPTPWLIFETNIGKEQEGGFNTE